MCVKDWTQHEMSMALLKLNLSKSPVDAVKRVQDDEQKVIKEIEAGIKEKCKADVIKAVKQLQSDPVRMAKLTAKVSEILDMEVDND